VTATRIIRADSQRDGYGGANDGDTLARMTSAANARAISVNDSHREYADDRIMQPRRVIVKVRSQHVKLNRTDPQRVVLQLRVAFIGHARHRRDLIGCSETRPVGAQSVRAL